MGELLLYRALRPILFRLPAETAHHWAVSLLANPLFRPLLALNGRFQGRPDPLLATDLCGIPLNNPIGLAAGFDKDAALYPNMHHLGFGSVEIGTVTAHPQAGNPRPRLFRLPADLALINRMGFNNPGAEAVQRRLSRRRSSIPLGGNIGKSKAAPMTEAAEDYARSLTALKDYVDYFVVNVSSPNTPNLRDLQAYEPLLSLLRHLGERNREPKRPILLKIAPDLDEDQLADIVAVVTQTGVAGVIATNTTVARAGLITPEDRVRALGPGGMSGAPLREASTRLIRRLRRALPERVDIVGVGGIFSGCDVLDKIEAGAKCVQIYTGWIYRGPNGIFRILAELREELKRRGYTSLRQAIAAGLN